MLQENIIKNISHVPSISPLKSPRWTHLSLPGSDRYNGPFDLLCGHRQTEARQEDHKQQVRPTTNPSRPENTVLVKIQGQMSS